VSVGGEAPSGTLAKVYAFDVVRRRWRRLADLPTPRHGLGVAAFGRSVYAIGGGPRPGLFVSDANESLLVPRFASLTLGAHAFGARSGWPPEVRWFGERS